MEKADILEMTVAYMRTVRHCASVSTSGPPADSSEQARTYLSGYRECAMEVCRFFQNDSVLPVGVPEVRAQLTRHLSGCFQRIQLDLQSAVDRPGQLSTTAMDAVSCKRRCSEEDRLPSPSSSCSSSHSSSSSPSPFSSPVLPPHMPSSSNPMTDLPRNLGSISAGTSVSGAFSSARLVAEPCRESKPQSVPAAAVPTSVLQPSSRPKLLKQTPRLAHHLLQSSLLSQRQQEQQPLAFSPQCLSPKKGDEFPTLTTAGNTPAALTTATPRNQSTIGSRTVAFFEPLPASEDQLSFVWRPW